MIYTEYRIYLDRCKMVGFENWPHIVVGKRYDDGIWEYVTGFAYGKEWREWLYVSEQTKDSNNDRYYQVIPVYHTEVEVVSEYTFQDKEMVILRIISEDKCLTIEKNSDSMVFNPYSDTKQVLILKSPQ